MEPWGLARVKRSACHESRVSWTSPTLASSLARHPLPYWPERHVPRSAADSGPTAPAMPSPRARAVRGRGPGAGRSADHVRVGPLRQIRSGRWPEGGPEGGDNVGPRGRRRLRRGPAHPIESLITGLGASRSRWSEGGHGWIGSGRHSRGFAASSLSMSPPHTRQQRT